MALLECTPDGRIRWCNPAAERLLGLAAGDQLHHGVAEADRAVLVELLTEAASRTEVVSCRVRGVAGAPFEVRADHRRGRLSVAVVDGSVLDARPHQVERDGLTGLATRLGILDIAQGQRRSMRATGQQPALLLVDLDGFKNVNDRFGHQIGDALLNEVAARLVEHVGDAGIVGRIGGDEFVVCVLDGGTDAALELARGMVGPFELPDDRAVEVTASIGIATLSPTADLNQTLARADQAMYQAKREGRATAVVYAPTAGTDVDVRYYDHEIARLRRRAERAERDERTGLPRYAAFCERHVQLLAEAHRTGTVLSVALVDLDQFHELNHRYLLEGGDRALRAVADGVVDAVPDGDEVYRYAGDELAILLPGTDEPDALAIGERVRAAVEDLGIEHLDSAWKVVTVSIGVCTHTPRVTARLETTGSAFDPAEVAVALVNGANHALLDAKAAGRNACRAAPPDDAAPPIGHRRTSD